MKTKAQIIAKIRNTKADIDQLIQDIESYNDNNPHGAYIEPDPDGNLARQNDYLDEMLRKLGASP